MVFITNLAATVHEELSFPLEATLADLEHHRTIQDTLDLCQLQFFSV